MGSVTELRRLRETAAALTLSVKASSQELASIAKAVKELVPEPPPKPFKEPWQIENEKRDEIRSVAKELGTEQLARFIAHRYRLSPDDPWVLSMVKLRESVGLDSLITTLRKRDELPL
jgi:hypothetical protein